MKRVKLGDICNPKQWKTITKDVLTEDGYFVYGANGIIGKYSEYNHAERTILVGCRGTCGCVTICEPFSYVNGNAMALDDLKDEVDIQYLFYHLKGRGFADIITGGVQPQIIQSSIKGVEINIPSKEQQAKIVKELDEISNLILSQNKKISLLDELVKARFVELFGDPINNNKQWPISTVGAIATDVKYGTSRPATKGGKFPYLRMNNLTYDGNLDLTDLKYIDIPDNEYEKCVVRRGDILFNRTNSVDLIGKTVAYDRPDEMIIAGYIIRVRLNEKLLPEVFSQYMNLEVMKKTLSSIAKGAVHQANINAQELKSIEVYLPEIGLQKEFVAFKQHIDKSKFEVQKKIDLYTELLNKKMDEYFNSEAN